MESPVPDSVAAIIPATNVESEFEAVQDGRIREIVMDNADSEPVVMKCSKNKIFSVSRPNHICSLVTCSQERFILIHIACGLIFNPWISIDKVWD